MQNIIKNFFEPLEAVAKNNNNELKENFEKIIKELCLQKTEEWENDRPSFVGRLDINLELDPIINFIKEWFDGQVEPVIFMRSIDGVNEFVGVPFSECVKQKEEFVNNLQNKIEEIEKKYLFFQREYDERNGEKKATKSDEEIGILAKKVASKFSQENIFKKIMDIIIFISTDECYDVALIDEKGSHCQCMGCLTSSLKPTRYPAENRKRILKYLFAVYPKIYSKKSGI